MISTLRGVVTYKDLKYLIIEVGGIGYKVAVSADAIISAQENKKIFLWTHLAVREDALDLYGFTKKSDLDFFNLLISVSGIGPKSAIGILNASSVEMLKDAISTNDTSLLTKVSGIGKKSAEKIILELKDKIGDHVAQGGVGDMDALDALQSLGYGQKESREALKKADKNLTTQDKIKCALKHLGSPIK